MKHGSNDGVTLIDHSQCFLPADAGTECLALSWGVLPFSCAEIVFSPLALSAEGLVCCSLRTFPAQVYELSSLHFLPKEWIMERWEDGFYITAMAGSAGGSSLVVMSKGTPYTQQSYKVGRCTEITGSRALGKH